MTITAPPTEAMTSTPVDTIPPLGHAEGMTLAAGEFDCTLALLRSLDAGDWSCPTVCPLWTVRDMAGHMLGMAEAQASTRQFLHDFRGANRDKGDGPMIDALTAVQVRERVALSTTELVARFTAVAPRAVRARRRVPALMRNSLRFKQDPPFGAERWQYGYLIDKVFTRDPWIHRLDISRAIRRPMVLSRAHDGRIVEDVVAEWARRHGRPFSLTLSGVAGGSWHQGTGEHIEMDALDFCWTLAGRVPGAGLLATPVPF